GRRWRRPCFFDLDRGQRLVGRFGLLAFLGDRVRSGWLLRGGFLLLGKAKQARQSGPNERTQVPSNSLPGTYPSWENPFRDREILSGGRKALELSTGTVRPLERFAGLSERMERSAPVLSLLFSGCAEKTHFSVPSSRSLLAALSKNAGKMDCTKTQT